MKRTLSTIFTAALLAVSMILAVGAAHLKTDIAGNMAIGGNFDSGEEHAKSHSGSAEVTMLIPIAELPSYISQRAVLPTADASESTVRMRVRPDSAMPILHRTKIF